MTSAPYRLRPPSLPPVLFWEAVGTKVEARAWRLLGPEAQPHHSLARAKALFSHLKIRGIKIISLTEWLWKFSESALKPVPWLWWHLLSCQRVGCLSFCWGPWSLQALPRKTALGHSDLNSCNWSDILRDGERRASSVIYQGFPLWRGPGDTWPWEIR